MARHNLVLLRGIVAADPVISIPEEDDKDQSSFASLLLYVQRADRELDDGRKAVRSNIPIITKEKEMVRYLSQVKANDILDLKGVFVTTKIKKISYCPYCGKKNYVEGTLAFINPLFLEKLGSILVPEGRRDESISQLTDKARVAYLSEHCEISNQIYAFGTILTVPKMVAFGDDNAAYKRSFCQFQMTIQRKKKLKGIPSRRDVPWIKSYGKMGQMHYEHLKEGTEIFVDGCLQTRNVQRHIVCGQKKNENGRPLFTSEGRPILGEDGCQMPYDWAEKVLEIIPFSIEYLQDCRSEEETLAFRENQVRQYAKEKEISLEEARKALAKEPEKV